MGQPGAGHGGLAVCAGSGRLARRAAQPGAGRPSVRAPAVAAGAAPAAAVFLFPVLPAPGRRQRSQRVAGAGHGRVAAVHGVWPGALLAQPWHGSRDGLVGEMGLGGLAGGLATAAGAGLVGLAAVAAVAVVGCERGVAGWSCLSRVF